MAKYRIAILPGDGVGKDVIEATMPILKKLEVDAEYIYGDIGWEFWRREGNALPDRTKKLLKENRRLPFRGHHVQAEKGRRRRARSLAPGQGLVVFQPHRPPSPGIRLVHQPPAVQGLPRKPA